MNLDQHPGYGRRDRRDSGPGFGTGLLVGGGLGLMAGKAECKRRLMLLKACSFRFGHLQKKILNKKYRYLVLPWWKKH
jgi:hypothetical protein